MSLINCTECGREISDKATSCPSCGAPISKKKFCKFCAEQIDFDCVVCPKCGKQVEEMHQQKENIVINNTANAYANANISGPMVKGRAKNKWISLFLCIFTICGHKFYEGKFLLGIVYIFTVGFFFIGWIIDIFALLFKPNPYYV